MEAWASLRALEVGEMRWQPVPVTDGHAGQKNLYALFVAGSWRKHLDPLVRWSDLVSSAVTGSTVLTGNIVSM